MEYGKIIFLHGASSSGKSTLASALQSKINFPFWHISIDHLRDGDVLPTGRFKSGEFSWKDEKQKFFDGYHASLASYATAGNNLIIEHIIEETHWRGQLAVLFAPFDMFFVAVHCNVETLREREKQRGDRPIGSAEKDFGTIHNGLIYDLEINSETMLEDNISLLLNAWNARTGQSAFFKMAE